jgi:CheY-like chemotaxis protein
MNNIAAPAPEILVVDDTPANLQLVAGMLREHGYKVRPVASAVLALQAAQAAPPDLILLDINMPEMDGYEVCRRLKAEDKTRDVPIIFLSALDDTIDKVKAFQCGGFDYIGKPFEFEEVEARVNTHLRSGGPPENEGRAQQLEKAYAAPESRPRSMPNCWAQRNMFFLFSASLTDGPVRADWRMTPPLISVATTRLPLGDPEHFAFYLLDAPDTASNPRSSPFPFSIPCARRVWPTSIAATRVPCSRR